MGDNGSKISNWVLESDQGVGASMAAEGSDSDAVTFSEVYSGLQRQHKLTKLQPATRYTFRLAAVNAIGKRCVDAGRKCGQLLQIIIKIFYTPFVVITVCYIS